MVQDEARFGRITHWRCCWCPPRKRPCIPQQIVREYISVFSAIAPKDGDLISLIFSRSDTDAMNIFLKYVSQQFSDSFLVMQVDGASWHHSRQLQVPENIRLLYQPPYSPEVNPAEHL